MIPARRWLAAPAGRLRAGHLMVTGAVVGFLTGIVATTGRITAPIFLAYGLARGAFISTEAAGSLAVYLSKSVVFRRFGALPLEVISQGLRLLMDALMLLSGTTMLWIAFR